MTATEDWDVAIVGAGPTGVVAASLLGRAGRRVVVLERADRIYDLPRAVHLDAEVMRIFQQLGLAERVAAQSACLGAAEFVDARGERIFGTGPRDAPPRMTRQGWCSDYMFYQPELEETLRAGLARHATVELRSGCDVEGIAQTGQGVTLDVHCFATRRRSALRAKWLLGCDGARSLVRRESGIRFESLGFDQKWLVVDARVRHPDRLPRIVQQVCDPARRATLVPSVGDHYRWELQLLPGEDPADLERPGRVLELLSRWAPAADLQLIRAVVYEFHGLLASRWRDRRVFLLGDAAHQTPPFLGQGLCQGVRDAWNLAWKLDRVLAGRVGDPHAVEALLDSYEAERAPNARAVVAAAVGVGRLIDALALQQTASPPARPSAGGGDGMAEGRAAYSGELELPKLEGGLLDPGEKDGPVGRTVPQPRVRTASGEPARLDDLLGDDFAVVAPMDGRFDGAAAAGARAAADRLCARWLDVAPGSDAEGWLAEVFDRHGALVVRPDRCVYATADGPGRLRAKLEDLADAIGAARR